MGVLQTGATMVIIADQMPTGLLHSTHEPDFGCRLKCTPCGATAHMSFQTDLETGVETGVLARVWNFVPYSSW